MEVQSNSLRQIAARFGLSLSEVQKLGASIDVDSADPDRPLTDLELRLLVYAIRSSPPAAALEIDRPQSTEHPPQRKRSDVPEATGPISLSAMLARYDESEVACRVSFTWRHQQSLAVAELTLALLDETRSVAVATETCSSHPNAAPGDPVDVSGVLGMEDMPSSAERPAARAVLRLYPGQPREMFSATLPVDRRRVAHRFDAPSSIAEGPLILRSYALTQVSEDDADDVEYALCVAVRNRSSLPIPRCVLTIITESGRHHVQTDCEDADHVLPGDTRYMQCSIRYRDPGTAVRGYSIRGLLTACESPVDVALPETQPSRGYRRNFRPDGPGLRFLRMGSLFDSDVPIPGNPEPDDLDLDEDEDELNLDEDESDDAADGTPAPDRRWQSIFRRRR